ncbi:hypothetical protein ACWC09_51915, partial [Streptomyces sp. NPDC001617]
GGSDASGLLSGGIAPWSGNGAEPPALGDISPIPGTATGGPGLVTPLPDGSLANGSAPGASPSGSVPEGAGAGMPFMPMAPGVGGAPKEEHRSDASGLLSGGVEPWSPGDEAVPGEGELATSGGTVAGGPGLVLGTGEAVPSAAGIGGVMLPDMTGADGSKPAKGKKHDDGVPIPLPLPVVPTGSVQQAPAVPPVPPATRTNGPDEAVPMRTGTPSTPSKVGVGGVSVPTGDPAAAGAEQAALDEAAAAEGAAAQDGGMAPPYGMPGGASRGGDERSDASGLLLGHEKGWADPDVEGLPSETHGAPAGGAALSSADSAAADEFAEARVALVHSSEAAEDTGAWEATDPAMLWALGRNRTEDEEEEHLPKYVLSDSEGWSDEDGAVSEAGVGTDEEERSKEKSAATFVEEPGWSDEDDAAFAARLGFSRPPGADQASAEPVTGPGLATWRRDRSQTAVAEESPMPATGYAGMLLSTADVPDEEDAEPEASEDDGDEAKGSRGISALLRQGADSWGAVPDKADALD